MALNDYKELKIFHLNRIRYEELWQDCVSYIRQTYNAINQDFNTASPFAQLLSVLLHLGRMIFYYIEDSITGLNIRTAYRPDQIKGLAMLAGHDASRTISARGAIKIMFFDKGDESLNGNICYIPNKTQIKSKLNGCTYTILLNQDSAKITMQAGNYLEGTIIQGEIKTQAATGTGVTLQSYNFAERNYAEIDQYYVNIYVNGEQWEIVQSLLDLGYNQKGCVVRTGLTGGIDVFFGNTDMGMCPPNGSTIIAEYVVSDGPIANLYKDEINSNEYWEIEGDGFMPDGTHVTLNDNFKIISTTDVIFGTASENTALTQLIAPHVSRSYVLANETNYRYFFKRMNMFSDVEIIQGSSLQSGVSMLQLAYDQANKNYQDLLEIYNDMLSQYGDTAEETTDALAAVQNAEKVKKYAYQKLETNSYRDNTIFIFLIPDITKRISSTQNYFSCDESLFTLSEDEQINIINLINASGQRIITVENRILEPKIARFAVNVYAKVWEGVDEQDVYTSGLKALSDYLLNFSRKDMLPLSDIISIFENNVTGIDSVKVSFDADVNNQTVYGENGYYGLDDFGDIMLTRNYIDNNGRQKTIRDILPLIRGGFTSPEGVEYSAQQSKDYNSAYNLIITGYSANRRRTLENYTALT